ncbi:hypothetical protein PPERSA_07267 [Pseudocohnilembus persalinus]|uniref:Uncharacterized protein n=1 Tax=Pseudocohnilembus persalinus TaxID=266149 RepID=A0A0V0QD09_PSEPJ|nr:hypothetical protein PPERSA_07267 [Pseudocohnilembus persalinus]|eukprot:KRX00070.1 hypothetical protein PPERSA_07267 [Pseudocohnilembus persalinus]
MDQYSLFNNKYFDRKFIDNFDLDYGKEWEMNENKGKQEGKEQQQQQQQELFQREIWENQENGQFYQNGSDFDIQENFMKNILSHLQNNQGNLESKEAIMGQIQRRKIQINENMTINQALYCGKLFARINFQGAGAQEWDLVLQSIYNNLQDVDKSNITEILWILGKSQHRKVNKGQIFYKLENKVMELRHIISIGDFVIINWSYARFRQGSQNFWLKAIEKLSASCGQMNQIDISNTCWNLAQIDSKIEQSTYLDMLWDQLISKITNNIEQYSDEQSFSIILSSVAKVNRGNQEFWQKMGQKFENIASSLSNQGITNSVWALGRKNVFEIQNWLKIEKIIIHRIPTLQYREVMAISVGCIKMQFGTAGLWEKLLEKIEEFLQIDDINKIDYTTLSSCSYILSQLGADLANYWQNLEKVIIQKIKQNDGQILEISYFNTILSSFSARQQGSSAFWKVLEEEAIKFIDEICLEIEQEKKEYREQLYKQMGQNQEQLEIKKEENQSENVEKKENTENKEEKESQADVEEKKQQLLQQKLLDSKLNLQKFDSKIVSNIIYGFTQRNIHISSALEQRIVHLLLGNLHQLNIQGVLNCLWGLVKRGNGIINKFSIEKDEKIKKLTLQFIEVLEQKKEKIEVFQPPDLGMLLYSFSKLQYRKSEKLVQIMEYYEKELMRKLEMQGFLGGLEEEGKLRELKQCIGQLDLSHILLGFDSYNLGGEEFWKAFEGITLKYMQSIEQESILSHLLRVGKKRFGREFFENFQSYMEKNIKGFSSTMLINVINCYNNYQFVGQENYMVLEQEIVRRIKKQSFSLQEICMVLQAFAKNQMGTHQFWFFCSQQVYKDYKDALMRVNLKNIQERQIFLLLLEICAENATFQQNTNLMQILKMGCSKIVEFDHSKIKEITTIIYAFNKLKIGDYQVWGNLERKFLYMKRWMNPNNILKQLRLFKSAKKGSPKLYNKTFEHLNQAIKQVKIDTLQDFCSQEGPIQQDVYSLYVNKLISLESNFQAYIDAVYDLCEYKTYEKLILTQQSKKQIEKEEQIQENKEIGEEKGVEKQTFQDQNQIKNQDQQQNQQQNQQLQQQNQKKLFKQQQQVKEEVVQGYLIDEMNNQDFQRLREHFEVQICEISKKNYTYKINRIKEAFAKKEMDKFQTGFSN